MEGVLERIKMGCVSCWWNLLPILNTLICQNKSTYIWIIIHVYTQHIISYTYRLPRTIYALVYIWWSICVYHTHIYTLPRTNYYTRLYTAYHIILIYIDFHVHIINLFIHDDLSVCTLYSFVYTRYIIPYTDTLSRTHYIMHSFIHDDLSVYTIHIYIYTLPRTN